MKKIMRLGIALLAILGAAITPAQATTATGTFNVTINLTSACLVNTGATAATFAYTSEQATAATFGTAFNVTCTNTLPIVSIALDTLSVTDTAVNLAYSLALASVPTVATGVAQAVTVNGTMAANQSGTCATATCTNSAATNKQRTVTITY